MKERKRGVRMQVIRMVGLQDAIDLHASARDASELSYERTTSIK